MEASTNNKNTTHSSAELRELCEVLSQELTMLNLKWETWKELFLADEARSLLNSTAGGFFWLVQELLRESIAMGVGRMTDRKSTAGRDNASIHKLLSMIQLDGCAEVDAVIAKDLETVDELCGKGGALRNLRHRRFAHSDFSAAVGKERLEKIDDEQIDQLLGTLDHLLNNVRTSLGMKDFPHSSVILLDGGAREMVEMLKRLADLEVYFETNEFGSSLREKT